MKFIFFKVEVILQNHFFSFSNLIEKWFFAGISPMQRNTSASFLPLQEKHLVILLTFDLLNLRNVVVVDTALVNVILILEGSLYFQVSKIVFFISLQWLNNNSED